MKQHIFKLRSRLCGQHVRTTIFAAFGEEGQTLANCGVLTMEIGEWQTFGALLLHGAANAPSGKVIVEGDQEVVARAAKVQ